MIVKSWKFERIFLLSVWWCCLSRLQDSGEPLHGEGPRLHSQRAIQSLSGDRVPPAPAAPLARGPPSQRAVLQPRLQTEESSLHRGRGRVTVRKWQNALVSKLFTALRFALRLQKKLAFCAAELRPRDWVMPDKRVTWRLPHCLCWNAALEKSAPFGPRCGFAQELISLSVTFVCLCSIFLSEQLSQDVAEMLLVVRREVEEDGSWLNPDNTKKWRYGMWHNFA